MLTPVELQNKTFKSGGLGYDKKDVEQFFREVTEAFTHLYSENIDLKDKVDALNDALQRYKTMESTLQRALVLAEKTAEDTKQAALQNARNIEKEAQLKSQIILADAKNELERVHAQTLAVLQQFEKYKAQFKSLATAQIELLDSDSYSLNADRLEASLDAGSMGMPRKEEKNRQAENVFTGSFGGTQPFERAERRLTEDTVQEKAETEQRKEKEEETTASWTERKPVERSAGRVDGFTADRMETRTADGISLTDSFGGTRFSDRTKERPVERGFGRAETAASEQIEARPFDRSQGNAAETTAEFKRSRHAERDAERSEGNSYWPDGRFPGRAVRKNSTAVFAPNEFAQDRKMPQAAEAAAEEEEGEADGFDFIDL